MNICPYCNSKKQSILKEKLFACKDCEKIYIYIHLKEIIINPPKKNKRGIKK